MSQTTSPALADLQQLSTDLFVLRDICNVYILRRGDRALLVDSGSGAVVDVLPELGIKAVDWVLHTHFHRDQCQGTPLLRSMGAKVVVPAHERSYFADAHDFWRHRPILDNYITYNDFFAPIADIPVDRVLEDGEFFRWEDVELEVVPAPGHTQGGMALVGAIEGQRIAFTGDVLHASGRPWTLFDLEWAYEHSQNGIGPLSLTVQTLADLDLDRALPSHGPPIEDPASACNALQTRLRAFAQYWQLSVHLPRVIDFTLPADMRITPITSHLWTTSTAMVSNWYVLVAESGKALFIDFGFPSPGHFNGFRFAEHSLDRLRAVAGLREIDVVLPTHYHDDHVAGLEYLHRKYGARLWAFENQVDILANPSAYKIPCLWPNSMKAERSIAEGETVTWEGISITAVRLPGHTAYHAAYLFELDGRRIAAIGDSIARVVGPRFLGPIYQNRFTPDDFVESAAKLRAFNPDTLLTGHWGALQVGPAFFDEVDRQARVLRDIILDLVPVPEEAGLAYDPNWATIYPYQSTIEPGGSLPFELRIINHLSQGVTASAELHLPPGWTGTCETNHIQLATGQTGTLSFTIEAPHTTPSDDFHLIAADVQLDERRFGPVAEAIIRT